ncbi:foldase PrsA, partial [Streptococcus suis]
MKQTKKILAGAVTLFSAVTLAACSNAADKYIITMKGNTITVSEFYEKVKT